MDEPRAAYPKNLSCVLNSSCKNQRTGTFIILSLSLIFLIEFSLIIEECASGGHETWFF
jgi:hypothetical protein